MEETVDFIRELFHVQKDFIPLHEPRFSGKEKDYVIDAINSTFVSSVGAYVNRFEEMMKSITGASFAIATVNGTAALHTCLILAGVKRDEEVITQPLTFVATANAISYTGAVPVFVDVDRDTLGLSPEALSTFLELNARKESNSCVNKNTGRRIAACVPMHTFGFPCRIDEITKICNQWHIPVIEDAAESLGSTYQGRVTGTYGLLGAFSFNGNKIVTCGGGGAIITNDEYIGKLAKHITTTAKIPHPWEYKHDHIGFNYRMPNLNAAMACAQMEQLGLFLEKKRILANKYATFFASRGITFLTEQPGTEANFWLMTLQLKDFDERQAFLQYTNDHGVMTRPAWKLMQELSMFKDCPAGPLENAKWLADRLVNIPSSVIFDS